MSVESKWRSSLTPAQFAERLEAVGNELIKLNPVECGLVFSEPDLEPYPGMGPICGTVGCHGAWLVPVLHGLGYSLEYPKDRAPYMRNDYTHGARLLAVALGFLPDFYAEVHTGNWDVFAVWARQNPELWGNEQGHRMFDSHGWVAFGFEHKNRWSCTLAVVGKHYLEVAGRVRALGENW